MNISLIVCPCVNGCKGKAQYLLQGCAIPIWEWTFSVCAQIKINLLIYPTLLGLHLYDCPQHHPCHSGHWFRTKTSCIIGLWMNDVDGIFDSQYLGMGELHPSIVVFSFSQRFSAISLSTNALLVSTPNAKPCRGIMCALQIVMEKSW